MQGARQTYKRKYIRAHIQLNIHISSVLDWVRSEDYGTAWKMLTCLYIVWGCCLFYFYFWLLFIIILKCCNQRCSIRVRVYNNCQCFRSEWKGKTKKLQNSCLWKYNLCYRTDIMSSCCLSRCQLHWDKKLNFLATLQHKILLFLLSCSSL